MVTFIAHANAKDIKPLDFEILRHLEHVSCFSFNLIQFGAIQYDGLFEPIGTNLKPAV